MQLLEQIGVVHRPLLPGADEDAEALEAEDGRDATPQAYVERVTLLKLGAARERLLARRLPAAPILCADTTVALGRAVLGKPRHDADAKAMLNGLSGRTHRVFTAVAVFDGKRTWRATSVSRVRFGVLAPRAIAAYVDSGVPQGKAGAYAIQSALAAHIEHIEGSYSGIMGLPLYETAALLRQAGVAMPL